MLNVANGLMRLVRYRTGLPVDTYMLNSSTIWLCIHAAANNLLLGGVLVSLSSSKCNRPLATSIDVLHALTIAMLSRPLGCFVGRRRTDMRNTVARDVQSAKRARKPLRYSVGASAVEITGTVRARSI